MRPATFNGPIAREAVHARWEARNCAIITAVNLALVCLGGSPLNAAVAVLAAVQTCRAARRYHANIDRLARIIATRTILAREVGQKIANLRVSP